MKKGFVGFGVLLVGLLLSVPAGAQAPFNLKELNQFLTDFPGFVQFMEDKGQEIEGGNRPETWKSMQIDRSMREFLSDTGWNADRFFYLASHVATGLMATEVRDRAPEIQAQLQAQKEAILGNPQIPEEMKQQLLAQMQSGMAQAGTLQTVGDDLPPDEMALIKANKDRINDLFSSLE